jgi:hypothetical protein
MSSQPEAATNSSTPIRWAVQIKKHQFFFDVWVWNAMRFVSKDEVAESEFGEFGFKTKGEAMTAAQAVMKKRGIDEAVLIEGDLEGETEHCDVGADDGV